MIDLWDFTLDELKGFVKSQGWPEYRAGQIREWMYAGAEDFSAMSNLPKAMRERLGELATINVPKPLKIQTSADGTVKTLRELADGTAVESVLMRYKYGDSACLSTQVGCRMNCKFCASASGGFKRNLTMGEMLGQLLGMERITGCRIRRIVLMGMGEPLDNFENTMRFLREITAKEGLNISARHISVSTCGIPDKMLELAKSGLPITLSVSLHAPDDETRSFLMPINKKYDINSVMRAAKEYFKITSRRVSYEYIMIDGINDSVIHAEMLADKLKGGHINLIEYNAVAGKDFKPGKNIKKFEEVLVRRGLTVTKRRKLGRGIEAACGQLAGEIFDRKEAKV
jgi:23S rRNA (adenine2503-C2)-methyltransferase